MIQYKYVKAPIKKEKFSPAKTGLCYGQFHSFSLLAIWRKYQLFIFEALLLLFVNIPKTRRVEYHILHEMEQ